MGETNLATVFSPNIFKTYAQYQLMHRTQIDFIVARRESVADMVNETVELTEVTALMITHYNEVFYPQVNHMNG